VNDIVKFGAGAEVTARVAVAFPELPDDDIRSLEEFVASPTVDEVTSIETVQLELDVTAPEANVTAPDPATAVMAPPVQVVDAFGFDATVMPVGKVSLKVSAVASIATELLSTVNVSVDVSP
jgi:hypothetical protein